MSNSCSRIEYNDGIYHREKPADSDLSKPVSSWNLNVHVDIKDISKAYKVMQEVATDENLTITLAMEDVRNAYRNNDKGVPPLIVVKHTAAIENPEKVLSVIEQKLIEAEVGAGKVEDFKGKNVSGSQYMEYELPDRDKYYDKNALDKGNDLNPPIPENPFNITIIRQPVHQEELPGIEEQDNEQHNFEGR